MNQKNKNRIIEDKVAALEFLTEHITIPSDLDMSDEDSDSYDELFEFLAKHLCDECIPLIINSYRSYSSTYLAESFAKVLSKQNQKVLNQYIITALKSDDIAQKESALFFAVEFASADFVEPLIEILRDEKSTEKIIMDTISLLEAIRKTDADPTVREIIEKEFRENLRYKKISEYQNDIEFRAVLRNINWEAKKALEKRDYKKVTELLSPYDGKLPKSAQKKLDIAKMSISKE